MSEKFVLVVSDEKDGKHGEISELDTTQATGGVMSMVTYPFSYGVDHKEPRGTYIVRRARRSISTPPQPLRATLHTQ